MNSPVDARRTWTGWRTRIAVAAALLVLLAGWLFWSAFEATQARRAAFVNRFRESFRSGWVKLGGEPRIEEPGALRSGFAPGVNLYRITAPIERDGKQLWGVWSYACNDRYQDAIFQFGYAEAATEQQLGRRPLPPKRYIDWATEMVDGIPSTAGGSATIVSSITSVAPGGSVTLVASAPAGTTCEFVTYPPDAAATPLPVQTPDENGIVRWTFALNPKYAQTGNNLRLIVKCIEQRGALRLENSTEADSVRVVAPEDQTPRTAE